MVFLDRVEGHPPEGKVDRGVEFLVLGSSQLHTPTRKPTSRQARASGTFSSDGCIAAVLDYLTKRTTRMVAPTRRSRTPQNSAYERATTLSSRKWTASQAAWAMRPAATRYAPISGAA